MDNNKKLTKPSKKADISRTSFLIPLRPSKKVLEKSKYYKGKGKFTDIQANSQKGYLYAQASTSNIKNIVKIKKNFSNFLSKKVEEIHKVLSRSKENKPKLNIDDQEHIKETSYKFLFW